MYYVVVPELHLVFGWSPKCACTTAKTAILLALGHEVTGNVHNDMLTGENLKSGKYGVYSIPEYRKNNDVSLKGFLKVCIIRNPYSRFISAVRQRSHVLRQDPRFCHMTPSDYLDYMEWNNYGEDHHFHPQTKNLRPFALDHVLDVSEMGSFFKILGLPYQGERFGRHGTSYGTGEHSVRAASFLDLTEIEKFSGCIYSWVDVNGLSKLRKLYASDFDFALRHGHHYDLPTA
jgi:hypothetical protein